MMLSEAVLLTHEQNLFCQTVSAYVRLKIHWMVWSCDAYHDKVATLPCCAIALQMLPDAHLKHGSKVG